MTTKWWLGCSIVVGSLALVGCGDDGGDGGSGGAGGGGTGGTAGSGGGSGSGGTAGTGGAAGSSGSGGSAGNSGSGGTGGAAGGELLALVRGTLFTTDMVAAQAKHDALASGGEAAAKSQGDVAHDVGLGTTLLGTTENAFLGIDRWTAGSNPAAFYGNADFQAAFATLFSGAPTLEIFQAPSGWHTWGNLDAADSADPHYFVVVRGKLAKDAAGTQPNHDALAAQGEPQAKAAGDVAHVVYLGAQDPKEFLAIDLWTKSDAMAQVYGDPDFQKAFGTLFESAPSLAVYQSTKFHQW